MENNSKVFIPSGTPLVIRAITKKMNLDTIIISPELKELAEGNTIKVMNILTSIPSNGVCRGAPYYENVNINPDFSQIKGVKEILFLTEQDYNI